MQKQEWCIPKVSAEFVAHMEDVLDLYAQPYDPRRRWSALTRLRPSCWLTPVPAASPAGETGAAGLRVPPEGTRNLFLTCDRWPLGATCRLRSGAPCRTSPARCAGWWMRPIQRSRWCRVVLDNLNTHRTASLYETFPAAEARRVAKRLEFHYTPQARELVEYGGNRVQRAVPLLPQAAPSPTNPPSGGEVQALVTERNAAEPTINWRFNTQDARGKLHRLYPFDSKHD